MTICKALTLTGLPSSPYFGGHVYVAASLSRSTNTIEYREYTKNWRGIRAAPMQLFFSNHKRIVCYCLSEIAAHHEVAVLSKAIGPTNFLPFFPRYLYLC